MSDLPPFTSALIFCSLAEAQYRIPDDLAASRSLRRAALALGATDAAPGPGDLNPFFHVDKDKLLARIFNNQGLVEYQMGLFRQAGKSYGRSIELYRKAKAAAVGSPLANLGELLRIQKRFAESRQHLLEALAVFEKFAGPDSLKAAQALELLGASLLDSGNEREARLALDRALRILEKATGASSYSYASVLVKLARIDAGEGQTVRAEERYLAARTIFESTAAPNHPLLIRTLREHAALLRRLKRKTEARNLDARRAAMQASAGPLRQAVSVDELRAVK